MAVGEVALVERARTGDHTAFEAIFSRYQQQIYNYVLRIMGNAEEAYDLTQDTFIRAYVALPRTSPDLNLTAWLFRIATNACRDQLRRRKVVRWQPLEVVAGLLQFEDPSSYTPEREAIRREQSEAVQKVLSRLSPDHRLCLVLKEYQGLSCDEIGQIMGKSRSAVKSLLFRAREEFRVVHRQMENEREV